VSLYVPLTLGTLGVPEPSYYSALLVFILRSIRRALISGDVRESFGVILWPRFVVIVVVVDGHHVGGTIWREFATRAVVN
jgi:hypothetical protein